jgi:Xaa-Pro dipeptidase
MMDYTTRMTALDALSVDAVALVPGANMTYFTGLHMHLSERPTVALLGRETRAIIAPSVEVPAVRDRGLEVFAWDDADGFEGAFKAALETLKLERIGVDGGTMRVFEYLALGHAGAEQLTDVGGDLLALRARKAPEEIAAIREAIRLSEAALAEAMDGVSIGMTEREIADRIDAALKAHGSDGPAFETLVQAGPNSAVPHGRVNQRPLGSNDFLLIDFGGTHQDYPADITRTFCLGTSSDEMRVIYEAVLAANRAAIDAIRPGVSAGEIDRAARDVIDAAGYGEYFIHRTGHGLGLEVHELPQIAPGVETPLETGNVFTVEPGIYVPGLGGVRIEDNVVVTDVGVEVLTSYPRELG